MPALETRRGRDRGGGVLQPLRPAHLPRAARPARRLRVAAVLDPPRRPADDPARGGEGAHRRRPAAPRLHCVGFEQDATRSRCSSGTGRRAKARRAVGCDGIHSVVRKQLYPDEGEPRYSGVNMWRGVTRWKPVLSGASMVRAGWLKRRQAGALPDPQQRRRQGRQLVNWLWEIETPDYKRWDWNRAGARRGLHRRRRELEVRLARRAGVLPRRRGGARVSDGRQGSAAGVELRPRHAARRCRASDGSRAARTARGRRSWMRGRWPNAFPRTGHLEALKAYEAERLGPTVERGAGEPPQSARRDPARDVRAHRRPAVRAHRRGDQRRTS